MEMKLYGDVNKYRDCVLLEIAFFQFESDKQTFAMNCMFASLEDLDVICGNYDYSDELPESELHYTTFQIAKRYSIWNYWEGENYIVMIDRLDNISIYKKVEGDIQEYSYD